MNGEIAAWLFPLVTSQLSRFENPPRTVRHPRPLLCPFRRSPEL